MTNPVRIPATLLTIVAATAALTTPAAAATTLRFSAHVLTEKRHGDGFHVTERLTDVATKRTAGRDDVTCAGKAPQHCHGTFRLDAGSIRFAIADTKTNEGTITGGTGAYAGRHGTVSVKNTKTATIETIKLR